MRPRGAKVRSSSTQTRAKLKSRMLKKQNREGLNTTISRAEVSVVLENHRSTETLKSQYLQRSA